MRELILSVSALATGVVGTSASAQRVYVPAGRWTVDGGTVRCSLARRLGDDNSPILLFSSYLGRDEPQFVLMRDGTQALPALPSRVTVTLSPGDVTDEVRVTRRRAATVDGYRIEGLRKGYFDRFATAASIRFSHGSRTYFTLATPQAARAIAVLRGCNDQLYRSWGIDTAARDRLRSEPEKIAGEISDTDYPSAAIQNDQAGISVSVLLVQVDGRVGRCSTVVSSRVEVLDTTSCRLMTERFRYRPAIDENGQPVSALVVQTITWRLG